MKNLQVNKVMPVIDSNFEEVKASLVETMEKYRGIVVTEEGLKDCKATQRDLAKIRNDIDSYRKLIKKEMTLPITEFESKCKELISLIKATETPILEGISLYDEKRRQEKIKFITDMINIVIDDIDLNAKYAAMLNVKDIKFTLTSSLKGIKEQIWEMAIKLRAQQVAEEEKIESDISIIETTVQASNEGKGIALDINVYITKYKNGLTLNNVIQAINNDRKLIEMAERKAVERVEREKVEVENVNAEPIKVEVPIVEKSEEVRVVKKCFYTLKVTHDLDHMRLLATFLKSNGFEYEKLEEGWI